MGIRIAIRKILCLIVIFNSIVSIIFAGDLLYVFYADESMRLPYSSFLLDGFLFWFVIIASVLNIATAKAVGNVKLRRIKFHHYFYGFITSVASFIFMMLYAPAYLFTLLMPAFLIDAYSSTDASSFTAFLLVYGGMTLIIDDVQDMSRRLSCFASNLKWKIQRFKRAFEGLHLLCCLISTYLALSIIIWLFTNRLYLSISMLPRLSAEVFASSLLVTSIWGLGMIKKRFWLKNLYVDPQRKR